VARVLKPGGHFIFTDPMQADDCPDGVLEPILARIHLASLGSPGFYREAAARFGLQEVAFEQRTDQLVQHYSRVLEETEHLQPSLQGKIDQAYLERMKNGLKHWINGGKQGHLAWGVFIFQKK
jgi:sarcosine/dimethylglycine N-methyltransferase